MNALAMAGDPTPLRLLIIDDSTDDAQLLVHELQRGRGVVTWERVDTAAALEAALQQEWDAITCDWVMPAFSAPAALKVLGAHSVDAPVIIVSGEAAQEVTVTAMGLGAHDVVSKQHLTRLGPAIDRELSETAVRRAHRQAETALKMSEARYRRLFEAARDGILILDGATGRITDVNPYLLELLGYSRKDLLGKQLWQLGPFEDIAASQEAFHDLQTKDYIRYEDLPLQRRDGRRADVEFVSNAYLVNGDRVIQCNIRDTTERKQAERAIVLRDADVERLVQERTAQGNAINKELVAFSHSVSHDLRAPLRHIEGFSRQLLEDHGGQLDGQARHCVDRILACTRRMERLIADLLSLSRVTLVEVMPQPVNLSTLCETIVADLRKNEPSRKVECVIAPAVVAAGDLGLLRIALENLLRNSWKYTSKHPVARIEFGTTEREGRLVYFVRDDGAGFDMPHAEKLFVPFQRFHGEGEFEGTGIGLATVQRIIHRHGGIVWAEAAVERGATFYFTLGPAGP